MCQCAILSLTVVQTLAKYAVYLYDVRANGAWEYRGSCTFYVEFVFDTAQLLVTLAHYIHIWTMHGCVVCAWVPLSLLLSFLLRRHADTPLMLPASPTPGSHSASWTRCCS